MKPGGRGGSGAHLFGINGLIALRILKLRLDIGRQRHLAQLLQLFQKNSLIVKPDQAVAPLQHLCDLSGKRTVSKGDLGSRLHFPARPDQTFPGLVSPVNEQQHLHRAASREPVADQSSGQHPRVVQHQTVSGPEKAGQVVKVYVFGGAGMLIQHQQPGAVPTLQRGLSNELLRQIKVKIRGFYGWRTSIPV